MPERLLFDVPLTTVLGDRFQPTGFPDIGHAEFKRPVRGTDGVQWVDALLIESTQSMANRLEAVGWDDGLDQPVATLDGLPYVRVLRAETGEYVTSSRTEAHRLASAFVKESTLDDADMGSALRDRLGLADDTPIPRRQIAAAVFALDPLCLIHGVFFADSKWPGQPKVARVLSGFVEATDVHRAESGGVKFDHVRHSLSESSGGTSEGYGTVPYSRTEWTAAEIVASFAVDTQQIRSYGLGDEAADLLETIALWEIRMLLDGGLRLRTACDLEPLDPVVVDRAGIELASADALAARVRSGIETCGDQLAGGDALEVNWHDGKKKTKKKGS